MQLTGGRWPPATLVLPVVVHGRVPALLVLEDDAPGRAFGDLADDEALAPFRPDPATLAPLLLAVSARWAALEPDGGAPPTSG